MKVERDRVSVAPVWDPDYPAARDGNWASVTTTPVTALQHSMTINPPLQYYAIPYKTKYKP